MGKDALQEHLDKGMYGTPLLKPDEQRKYLGTFRERVYLTMTIRQMKDADNQKNLIQEIRKHPECRLFLNGEINSQLQSRYIRLVKETKIPFTLVNNQVTNDPDSIGLVLYAKEAVDEPVIDVEAKYPEAVEVPKEKPEKKGIWQRLFH